MRHAGASSLLPPDPNMTSRFGARDAYFDVPRTVPVDTQPLDRVIDDDAVIDQVYMKIDIEGFALDIL